MKCQILHESAGRLRIHACISRMTLSMADILEYAIAAVPGVTKVQVFDRTCDAVILYTGDRAAVTHALSRFSFDDPKAKALVPERTGRELNRYYEEKLANKVILHYVKKLLLPVYVRRVLSVLKAARFILKGLKSLLSGRLKVEFLDAAAIAVSMIRGDFSTASSVMFLLQLGDILEEWTHRKSLDDLARTMALEVDRVWLKTPDGREVLTDLSEVHVDDVMLLRSGEIIPLDGRVLSGECTVNQAAITGESLPVRKTEDSLIYAGTVLEEGEILAAVTNDPGTGRYDRIVKMVEESEKLKSVSASRASALADRLVPWSLGGSVLTYLLTQNATKAVSVLMVDFSCALKLSIPLLFLSAIRECSDLKMTVKGGRFLEEMAEADTIVFDKTGTLTHASPRVYQVVPFGDTDPDEALRLAACLEEHFPHSIANAVVQAAKEKGLQHEEKHAKVNYIVAHGIQSSIDGKTLAIGSYHFIFEDEKCRIPEGFEARFEALPPEYSHLYFAENGELIAVILIEDPIRDDAAEVIRELKSLGIGKTVMMTGDSERTARAVAAKVGVDEYHAEVLPEDKAAFVREEHAAGRRVIMLGDGINDSPALSEADVGIAVASGAAIAREISDITIRSEDLRCLVLLRQLSLLLADRIRGNYRFIMLFNGTLIALGVLGILPPAASAVLHNSSTLLVALKSMQKLLKNPD